MIFNFKRRSIQLDDDFYRAYFFSAQAHNGQLVLGTELPYIIHISQVCMELIAVSDSSVDATYMLTCAALHDVLEDTNIKYAEIVSLFGERVAEGVSALTKNKLLPKEDQIPESIQRIRKQPKEIWMVKLADRIANLNEPPIFWANAKRAKYLDASHIIYEELKTSNYLLAQRILSKMENYKTYITGSNS